MLVKVCLKKKKEHFINTILSRLIQFSILTTTQKNELILKNDLVLIVIK